MIKYNKEKSKIYFFSKTNLCIFAQITTIIFYFVRDDTFVSVLVFDITEECHIIRTGLKCRPRSAMSRNVTEL